MLGLKPLEIIYLTVALIITGHQIIARDGVFDPVALGAIAFWVGLIPVSRADRKKRIDDDDDDPPSMVAAQLEKSRDTIRRYLRDSP